MIGGALSPAVKALADKILGGAGGDMGSSGGMMTEGGDPTQGQSPSQVLGYQPGGTLFQGGQGGGFQAPRINFTPGPSAQQPEPQTDIFGPQIEAQQKELEEQRRLRREAYQHLIDNHYPTMKSMKFGTKDAIFGLLPSIIGLLAGRGGAEFAGGFAPAYLQGKQQGVDQQNQEAVNQFGAREHQLELAAKLAEQGVGDVQGNINTLFTRQNQEFNRQDRQEAAYYRRKNDERDDERKLTEDRDRTYNQAALRYQNDTSYGGMVKANAKIAESHPELAKSDDTVRDDYLKKAVLSNKGPIDRYAAYVDALDKKFGMIPASDSAKVTRMKQGLIDTIAGTEDPALKARASALLDSLLPPPSDEKTLVKQKQDDYSALQWAKYNFQDRKWGEQLALQRSRLDVYRDAVNNAVRNGDIGLYRAMSENARSAATLANKANGERVKAYDKLIAERGEIDAAQKEYDTNKAMDAQAGVKGEGKYTQAAKVKLDGIMAKYPEAAKANRIDLIKQRDEARAQTFKADIPEWQGATNQSAGIDITGGMGGLGSGSTAPVTIPPSAVPNGMGWSQRTAKISVLRQQAQDAIKAGANKAAVMAELKRQEAMLGGK